MKSIYYVLIGLLMFYLDTLLTFSSPITIGHFSFILVPHLSFLFLMIIAIYKNTSTALILGVLLGIMQDLYFGQVYGVYLFGYIVSILIADKFLKVFFRDHTMLYGMILLGVIFLEIFVMVIYSLLGLIDLNMFGFLVFRILPTLILNSLLLIFMYFIFNRFINQLSTIDTK